MKRYLRKISLHQAIDILTRSFPRPARSETLRVEDANGRILASPVYAQVSIPAARIAAMDGLAVKSVDTLQAQDQNPCELTGVVLVSTGQEIPSLYDAVIPSEEVWFSKEGTYKIRKAARAFQYIREPGEEIRQGRLILHPGHQIIPSDIGALLTYGIREIEVRTLLVGLIPTGDELISSSDDPEPGQVRESNTAVIAASLIQAGIKPVRYPIVPDDPDRIRTAITTAKEACDMVIISAGSSAGSRDHTREVIEEMGTVFFHGVAMRPGKTVLCGNVGDKAVIGLPGQPVASLTAWRELVTPLLRYWEFTLEQCPLLTARTAEPIPSDGGIDEFVPVSMVRILGEEIVLPRPRGAAGQMQIVRSNAVLHIPASKEGYREGAIVTVQLIRPGEREQAILIAGISDLLTDHLQAVFKPEHHHLILRPLSAIGAVAAFCKGICHGIFLMQACMGPDSDVSRILRTGCPDPIRAMVIGTIQGDQVLLVFRNTAGIIEEISPLIQFLSSPEWRKSGFFPEEISPEDSGNNEDLKIQEICKENTIHQSTGSIPGP